MSANSTPFAVAFGKVARTLEYRDSTGCITFTFDIPKEQRCVVLEHHSVRTPRPRNYGEAFARTKQFLESHGYRVEEFGVAHPPAPLTEEEAAAFIRGQISQPPPSSISLVVPPVRASFKDDADGSLWNLWLVAELKDGPHRGYKLVFHEQTRQFGVASPTDVFHGFWGSFSQTLDALVVA